VAEEIAVVVVEVARAAVWLQWCIVPIKQKQKRKQHVGRIKQNIQL
jgi:hypothetical protein